MGGQAMGGQGMNMFPQMNMGGPMGPGVGMNMAASSGSGGFGMNQPP